jgi:hypothetical protein
MQAEVDKTGVGHGRSTRELTAILTPLERDQKQKAAEAAFCWNQHRISPAGE